MPNLPRAYREVSVLRPHRRPIFRFLAAFASGLAVGFLFLFIATLAVSLDPGH